MPKKNKAENQEVEAYMLCDEGGTHNFRLAKEITCCDRLLCICCFPCYAICSCLLSEGAALANPLFEQMCCSKSRNEPDEKGTVTCVKCGLTEREAIDLSDARTNEASRGNRTTGYFSNAMSLPSAAVSNQPQSPDNGSPTNPSHSDS